MTRAENRATRPSESLSRPCIYLFAADCIARTLCVQPQVNLDASTYIEPKRIRRRQISERARIESAPQFRNKSVIFTNLLLLNSETIFESTSLRLTDNPNISSIRDTDSSRARFERAINPRPSPTRPRLRAAARRTARSTRNNDITRTQRAHTHASPAHAALAHQRLARQRPPRADTTTPRLVRSRQSRPLPRCSTLRGTLKIESGLYFIYSRKIANITF